MIGVRIACRYCVMRPASMGELHRAFGSFEFVVFGEVENEFPGQRLEFAKTGIDDHAFDAVNIVGDNIGGISEMATVACGAARAKLRHHTCKAFCPVARAKALSFFGNAMDD